MTLADAGPEGAPLAARNVPDDLLESYVEQDSPDALRSAVHQARERHYALEPGENEPDVACLGAAIMHGGSPVGALSITTLATRMTAEREAELAQIIAREIPPLLPQGLHLLLQ